MTHWGEHGRSPPLYPGALSQLAREPKHIDQPGPQLLTTGRPHPRMDVIYLCSILENPECHVHHCAHQVIGIC